MKYLFYATCLFCFGFLLAGLSTLLQIAGALLGFVLLVAAVYYYIEVYVNAVRV